MDEKFKIINLTHAFKNRVVVEDYDKIDESFFSSLYINAFNTFVDIVKENRINKNNDEEFDDISCANNIIAFIGERGTGKTSAMATFANMLVNLNKIENKEIQEIMKKSNFNTKLTPIEIMPLIDPSILNGHDSLIEIVIATIFREFKRIIEKDNKFNHEHRQMISEFTNIYNNLKTIYSGKNNIYNLDNDNLEVLNDLSSSIDLRKNLRNLIELYLKINKKEGGILVLQIDDLDTNISNGFKLFEDIRKYLILDNVVILISMKTDQAINVLKEKLSKDFNVLEERNNLIEEYAIQYLEKLIPLSNRIIMIDILDKNVKIKYSNYGAYTVQDLIIKIIYEKVGFLICKSQYGVNKLMPKTLRELNMFLYYLEKIDIYDSNQEGTNNKEKLLYLDKIEEYYYDIWIPNNLDYDYSKFLNSIRNINLIEWNDKIVSFLITNVIKKHREIYDGLNTKIIDYINQIKDSKGGNYNKSLADVIKVIDICNLYYDNELNIKKFLEIFMFIYSIKIYKESGLYKSKDEFSLDNYFDIMGQVIAGNIFANLYSTRNYRNAMAYRLENKEIRVKEKFNNENNSNSEDLFISYLLLFLIIPKLGLENILKEREEKWWGVSIGKNQVNYYLEVPMLISKCFYKQDILNVLCDRLNIKEIDYETSDIYFQIKELNKNIDEWFINYYRYNLFYNLGYIYFISDYFYRESNKKRLGNNWIEYIVKSFIEIFNKAHIEFINNYAGILDESEINEYKNIYLEKTDNSSIKYRFELFDKIANYKAFTDCLVKITKDNELNPKKEINKDDKENINPKKEIDNNDEENIDLKKEINNDDEENINPKIKLKKINKK